jgi:hypothetical protein
MGATFATILPALHEHTLGKNVINTFFKSSKDINPLLASMEDMADTGEGMGRKLIVPFVYGTGTSVGQNITKVTAKANGATAGSAALYGRWECNAVELDAAAQWDRGAVDAAFGRSAGEAFKLVSTEIDTKIAAMRKLLAMYSFGDGTGALGTIVTLNASPAWITVGADEINRFEEGQDLVVATTTTGAKRNSGTTIAVTGTDPDTNKIFLASTPLASTAWDVGDQVFLDNDAATGAGALSNYAAHLLPWGMRAWTPGAGVTDATTFNGVTRDGKWQLAGHTYNCAGIEPEGAFIKALGRLFQFGGVKADMLLCNPMDYDGFIADKDKSKIVQISVGKYELGFDGFKVNSLAGNIPVVPDAFCPSGTFYAGSFNDAEFCPRLVYVGDLVQMDDKDGQEFRLVAGTRQYRAGMYFRGNIVLPAAGHFVRGYGLSV